MGFDDLTQLGLLVLGAVLVALGRVLMDRMLARSEVQQNLDLLERLTGQVVRAAEQLGFTQGWSGRDKYRWASERLVQLAARYGIQLDERQIRTVIEAAVQVLKSTGGELRRHA